MPMLIEYLDAIARKKGRDILFLDFPQEKGTDSLSFDDWELVPVRQQIIAWLDSNEIEWRMCGRIANENMMGGGYQGRIYVCLLYTSDAADE